MKVVSSFRIALVAALAAGLLVLSACDRNAPPLSDAAATPAGTAALLLPPTFPPPATPVFTSTPATAASGARPSASPGSTRTPFATPAQTFRYVVQLDDTLSGIAARFKTSVEMLVLLNNLTGDLIVAGQQLSIPGTPPTATNTPRPPTATATARPTPRTYVVRPGDYLELIAARYNTTVSIIIQYNGLRSRTLYPGQILKIP